jgi:hypothetical protein
VRLCRLEWCVFCDGACRYNQIPVEMTWIGRNCKLFVCGLTAATQETRVRKCNYIVTFWHCWMLSWLDNVSRWRKLPAVYSIHHASVFNKILSPFEYCFLQLCSETPSYYYHHYRHYYYYYYYYYFTFEIDTLHGTMKFYPCARIEADTRRTFLRTALHVH